MNKKILISLAVFICITSVLITACNTNTPFPTSTIQSAVSNQVSPTPAYENRTLVKVATLKGPTGIGMVKLFDDNDKKLTVNRYETTIVGTPDEIVGKISSGEIDIAAVPTNLAATLYNKTEGKVKLLAINTLGVLYILEKGDTVTNIADLKGKKLYASGKGSTPEFILNYILTQNGIDPAKDLTIEYKTEHSELATLAAAGNADLVLLPEPFVTSLLMSKSEFKKKIDLSVEWEKATKAAGVNNSALAMGGLIVRTEFLMNNKAAVDAFLTEYNASVDYVNSNLTQAADLVVKYGIMAAVGPAKLAIPSCNIVFIAGADMKTQVANIYDVFFTSDPKSIGGKLPGDDFYYMK